MARTHYVKSFRGQRKCQHQAEGSYARCGKTAAEHEGVDHPFTQLPLRCQHCGADINIGDPYKWVAPRAGRFSRGRRMNRHQTCPGWKASELTSSPVLSVLYAAQEDFDFSGVDTPASFDEVEAVTDAIRDILSSAAEAVREAAEMRIEAADNIESGFGHETYQSEELRSHGDELEQWADEMESWDPSSQPDEPDTEDEGFDEDEYADELLVWYESAVDEAQSLIDDIPMG